MSADEEMSDRDAGMAEDREVLPRLAIHDSGLDHAPYRGANLEAVTVAATRNELKCDRTSKLVWSSVSQRSRRQDNKAPLCANSLSKQRYRVASPTTAIGLPNQSDRALQPALCRTDPSKTTACAVAAPEIR